MTSLKTSIKTITYLSDIGCLEIQGASLKTIKRDYISIMPKPDGLTAAKNLAEAFEHYNEWHPHSALGYRSPREYLRQRACNGLSDNRCLEI
ncbi:hypothetical protein B6D24_03745 [Escherichia coli]|nr:hypothetical protein B6D24_03745 [Escherichia coli]